VHRPARSKRHLVAACAAAALVGAILIAIVFVTAKPAPRSADARPPDAAPQLWDEPPLPASAAPSTSASPSATPSSNPSPPPRPGGKPRPANTGVPAETWLTVVNGNQTYSTDNQVVSGLDIHGFVQIRARNVTIRNSVIRGGPNPSCNSSVLWIRADSGASATIEDSEIVPSSPSPCLDGIWAANATLVRLNIHGAVDGVKAYDNVTLRDSYVHDLSWFASDPNQGGGPTHNDAVQTYQGNRHIVLRHNTMDPGSRGNAAYQVTQDGGKASTDIHVENNWLDGGNCTLNFAHHGGPVPMTGIFVSGNRFGRHSVYQCPILVSTQTVLSQNTGNVWDDTAAPIPPPDRHD
jgi:pectate lyase